MSNEVTWEAKKRKAQEQWIRTQALTAAVTLAEPRLVGSTSLATVKEVIGAARFFENYITGEVKIAEPVAGEVKVAEPVAEGGKWAYHGEPGAKREQFHRASGLSASGMDIFDDYVDERVRFRIAEARYSM